MEALVKKSAVVGLSLEEFRIPQLRQKDVLIKILRTSLCGTDLKFTNGRAKPNRQSHYPWSSAMSLLVKL